MTKREAINILVNATFSDEWQGNEDLTTAYHMAIKALEQEPCDDVISRQAVDELSKALVHTTKDKADFLCNFWEGLRKLPPVIPQSKTGHWINRHIISNTSIDMIVCSECGEEFSYDAETGISEYNYCPNCGAKNVKN